jgi:tetratricopeptide (TPR) repeat protein
VAKKKKASARPATRLPDLQTRTGRALGEGRFQAALELAKELVRHAPGPGHQALLRDAYLGRARQLRGQGHTRDAVTVIRAALALPDPEPAWREELAEELAACGEVREALALFDPAAITPGQARVLARGADRALQEGPAGRALLPESLHADFDRVFGAFAQLEAGQDDAAREALQAIGLRSPFLEWKVLLRGLLAYYHNDDARALENWQRLNPERLPGRLAAPFRFRLDAVFRVTQPPNVQALLQRQADELQGVAVVRELRGVQAALAGDESLTRPFRLAEALLPALRQHGPHLVARLAACFYWTVIANGQAEDILRYQRVFGTPADDPRLDRLRALVCEHGQEVEEAHRCWHQYEQSVATAAGRPGASAWPGDQADRVRALVWYHMGQNAAALPDPDDLRELPRHLRSRLSPPKLKPGAEACFQNSLKLAPDQLQTYAALFAFHQRRRHEAKTEEAGRRLLERFPDHAPTLEALADLYMHQGRYAEALGLFERAMRSNPLSRQLRGKISSAHLFQARAHAEEGHFEEARAEYRASLAHRDGESYPALCKWAACEFKAGNPDRAEELLREALTEAGTGLAVAYSMVIEAIRLKLPRPLKTRFDREFNAALAEPPSAAAAAAILSTTAAHRAAGITYHGQKTHEKKVLAYADKARRADFTEAQLGSLCASLIDLGASRAVRTFTALGQQLFAANPYFPLLEVQSYLEQGPDRCDPYRLRSLLEQAHRLAEQMPRDPRQQDLLQTIGEYEQTLRQMNPFLAMLGGDFDPFDFFPNDDDYDDEDDEDDDYDEFW